ncbi:MAG: ATP-dependent zinc metalloprotease FtsH [Planctomycetota bacterium]|jgi:cell division protease FtsH
MPSGRNDYDEDPGQYRPQRMFDFRSPRMLIFFLALAAVGVLLVLGQQDMGSRPELLRFAQVMKKLERGEIEKLIVDTSGNEGYSGTFHDGEPKKIKRFVTKPTDSRWTELHEDERRRIKDLADTKGTELAMTRPSPWLGILPQVLLIVLAVGIIWYMMSRYRGAGGPGSVLSFGKSRATLVSREKIKTTFKDVAGIEEAKDEVQEIINFLKDPRKFQRLGGRIPKGALLVGLPGCGKTLLARAIAGEADVPFYSISGSDFVEMFVGVGASRVRDLFQQARNNTPCVIFLDEIDAVGRRRGTGLGGGHDEREQTLNAILVEMDGFESDEKVIVLAATNRPDVLDPALLRPGRFDRHIYIDPPDLKGRKEIFKIYARRIKLGTEIDFEALARMTPTFTGANIEAMMNEAAIMAVMRGGDSVEMKDLEEARDKVKWGREKRSRVMAEEERENTALHESGHVIVTVLSPEVEPLHKVTIVHRGAYLGATMQLPVRDEYSMSRKKLIGQMRVLYGGRAAEEIFAKDMTSGAAADIRQATEIARRMVCEWGMSESIGPISYETGHENVFLGYELSRAREFSEETARSIDEEVKRIIGVAYDEAVELIKANREALLRIRDALLEREVLTRDEVEKVMRGETLPPPEKDLNNKSGLRDDAEDGEAAAAAAAEADAPAEAADETVGPEGYDRSEKRREEYRPPESGE